MQTTLIKPKKLLSKDDFLEIWQYRELLLFFTWRNLKVRYKQTLLGAVWAIFQPFMTMVVFSVFFGSLAKMPSDGVPYPIFVYTGLLFWQFFLAALSDSSSSLSANLGIISKVYFPRLIIPISSVLTKLVDFFVASIILIGLMFYYGFHPGFTGILLVPIFLLISAMAGVGTGLILSAADAKYHDVKYVLPYFLQILLYVTPVIYPASIAGKYSWILGINPMTGVIQGARAAFLGTTKLNWTLLSLSFVSTAILLVIGYIAFKKTERIVVDIM